MLPRSPDILVLTPRGGIYNHRYVVADDSPLDASGCGRIYREAKDVLGESGFGCGTLNVTDGGSFAAVQHVVAQQDTTGRRGAEWLIVVDPRIEGLDAAGQKRLQQDLEERLSHLSLEVLDRISWSDHAESEVTPNSTLQRWRQDITPLLANVRLPAPRSSGKEIGGRTGSGAPGATFFRIAVLVAVPFVGFFVLQNLFQPPPGPEVPPGHGPQTQEASAVLDKAATTLQIQYPTTDSEVIGRLSRLFSDANAIKAASGKLLKDLLNDVRRSAMGNDRVDEDLLKDDQFWEFLKKAYPGPQAPPNLNAFLTPEDAAVVADIPDPKYVRDLAKVVRGLRELDTFEAKPDDANLVPIFKSIRDESEAITRSGVDESLTIFTRADAALAHKLLRIFQNEDVSRMILEVRDRQGAQESLGSWMRTLGSPGRKGPDGLFSEAHFNVLLKIAEEKNSKPKHDCITLLQTFCRTCTDLVRKFPQSQATPR